MKKVILFTAILLLHIHTAFAQEWYEGGSLHNSKIREWHTGSAANKLATAGDWAAPVIGAQNRGRLTMQQLKRIATDLTVCIDTGTKGMSEVYQQKTSEVAVMCYIMLKPNYTFLK